MTRSSVTASGPNGTTTVPIRKDGSPIFRTDTPGTYTLKATWRVVACRDAAGNEQYAEAASPPQSLTVLARDQKGGFDDPGGHRP